MVMNKSTANKLSKNLFDYEKPNYAQNNSNKLPWNYEILLESFKTVIIN